MRGQKLFVRPIETGDAAEVREFLTTNGEVDVIPACGLLGKLLGRVVAVMAIDVSDPSAIRLGGLLVDRELRRKRIGRIMMNEAELIAAKMERDWLVAEGPADAREFLRRVGFTEDGSRMVKRVQR
jgi:GNAT superfamily N-acetyltransferase